MFSGFSGNDFNNNILNHLNDDSYLRLDMGFASNPVSTLGTIFIIFGLFLTIAGVILAIILKRYSKKYK